MEWIDVLENTCISNRIRNSPCFRFNSYITIRRVTLKIERCNSRPLQLPVVYPSPVPLCVLDLPSECKLCGFDRRQP
jgi:hypothetical protein